MLSCDIVILSLVEKWPDWNDEHLDQRNISISLSYKLCEDLETKRKPVSLVSHTDECQAEETSNANEENPSSPPSQEAADKVVE